MAFLPERQSSDLRPTLTHYDFILTSFLMTFAKGPFPNEVTFTGKRVRTWTYLWGELN